jgi:hypothetical protein
MVERHPARKREIRVDTHVRQPELLSYKIAASCETGLPFLKKPFTSETLLSVVREVLAGPPAAPDQKNAPRPGHGDVEWVD